MEEQTKYEVATRPNPQDSLALQKVTEGLFRSGLFPNAKNAFGAFAITQYGLELGIGPMMSLKNINLIQGQLAANGQLMLSLAMAKGTTFKVLVETNEEVSIQFSRSGNSYTSTFTMEDAKLAGLTGKDNWKKYPKDMLYWRAVAKGVRRVAPDAVMGLYTPDEITSGEIILTESVPIEIQKEPQEETNHSTGEVTGQPPEAKVELSLFEKFYEESDETKQKLLMTYVGDFIKKGAVKEQIIEKANKNFDKFKEKFEEWVNA